MAYETNWLRNRIAAGTATLLTGAALATGGAMLAPIDAHADETADAVATEAAEGGVLVNIGGSYDVSSAQELLDNVNELREQQEQEDLAWSTGLEEIAQAYAAATAAGVAPSTVEGVEATSVFVASGSSLAPEALLDQLNSDDGSFVPCLADAGVCAVGIAVYTADDGTVYLAVAFGSDTEAAGNPQSGGNAYATVPASALVAQVGLPSLERGGSGTASCSFEGYQPVSAPVWSSSNTDVATVDPSTGAIVANAVGETVITLSVDGVAVASATLTVAEPSAVSATLVEVSTPAGVAPELPATVEVTYSDGSTAQVPVAWEEVDPDAYAQAGSFFTVTGTVEGVDGVEASAEVTVGEPAVSSVTEAATETVAGTAPELPATVEVVWTDGTTTEEEVVWDEVDPDAYAQAGAFFTVSGTLASDPGVETACTVTVEEAPVTMVDATPQTPETDPASEAPDVETDPASEAPDGEGEEDNEETGAGIGEEGEVEDNSEPGLDAVVPDENSPTGNLGTTIGSNASNVGLEAPNIMGDGEEDDSVDEVGGEEDEGDEGTDDTTEDTDSDKEADLSAVSIDPDSVTTTVGTDVELPETVKVVWDDGSTTEEEVVWDEIDPDAYARSGQFYVDGTVDGENGQVEVTIKVTVEEAEEDEPTIKRVVNPAAVTTTVGVDPELPETVEVVYSNGETDEAPVTWEEFDEEKYAQEGNFTVEGTVEGTDLTVSVVVNVEAAPATAESVEAVKVETPAGITPELPETVEVTYSDGSVEKVAVTWEAVDASLYAKAGESFTVEGALEGVDDLTVSAEVTVGDAVVSSVEPATTETVAGTAPTLPATVKATWSDGSTTDVDVTWDAVDAASYAQAGSFIVNGTIAADPEAEVVCTVTVAAAPATAVSVETPANVSTDAGVAPALPATVNVVYSDGSVKAHSVTWDAVSEDSYHNGGSFTVNGTVADVGMSVQVTVVVADATVTGVQNNLAVQTRLGVAPSLPETASVRWSNGDVTDEKVTWNAVDPSSYQTTGTFTVNGTVMGYTIPCTVTVVDQVVQTGDDTSMVPVVVGAVAGVAIVAVATALIVRSVKKNRG